MGPTAARASKQTHLSSAQHAKTGGGAPAPSISAPGAVQAQHAQGPTAQAFQAEQGPELDTRPMQTSSENGHSRRRKALSSTAQERGSSSSRADGPADDGTGIAVANTEKRVEGSTVQVFQAPAASPAGDAAMPAAAAPAGSAHPLAAPDLAPAPFPAPAQLRVPFLSKTAPVILQSIPLVQELEQLESTPLPLKSGGRSLFSLTGTGGSGMIADPAAAAQYMSASADEGLPDSDTSAPAHAAAPATGADAAPAGVSASDSAYGQDVSGDAALGAQYSTLVAGQAPPATASVAAPAAAVGPGPPADSDAPTPYVAGAAIAVAPASGAAPVTSYSVEDAAASMQDMLPAPEAPASGGTSGNLAAFRSELATELLAASHATAPTYGPAQVWHAILTGRETSHRVVWGCGRTSVCTGETHRHIQCPCLGDN